MKYFYDLHIHTALSPCADMDMSPNNIVNMSLLKKLDFIAITDHNTLGNVEAVIKCAEDKGLMVIPGIEVESNEEVHMICLFSNLTAARQMDDIIRKHLPDIKNRPDIFGEQILYDCNDRIIAYDERLLLTATSLTVNQIKIIADQLNGLAIPAHIDRDSFSIISNLAFIPDELNISTIEISTNTDKVDFINRNKYLKKYKVIVNSDAHYLQDISEADYSIELDEKSIDCLLKYLKEV